MSLAQLINGFRPASPNRFSIVMPPPPFITVPDGITELAITCKAVELPQAELGVPEVFWSGRAVPLAGDLTFSPVTFTFIMAENYKTRDILENWINNINNFKTNVGNNALTQYSTTIKIQARDKADDSVLKTYTLFNAFVPSISNVSLDRATQNTISEFTGTIRYEHFEFSTSANSAYSD